MSIPSTLLGLAGGQFNEIDWSNCAIVMIDFQNEYVDGAMPVVKLLRTRACYSIKLGTKTSRYFILPITVRIMIRFLIRYRRR